MKLGNLKIGVRLGGGFALVVIFTLIVGSIAITGMLQLADLTAKMYRHPLTVSNAVRDIKANIIAMHRSMKDVVLAQDGIEINNAEKIVAGYEQEVFKSFEIIFERFLGDQSDVKAAHQAFSDWKAIRDEVIQITKLGDEDKAAAITKGKGARHVALLNQKIQFMINFASKKADSFFKNAQDTKEKILLNMYASLIVMFIMSILISLFITRSLTTPVSEIVDRVKDIAKGDLEHKIQFHGNDEIGKLSESVNQMVDISSEVARQANVISTGNYTEDIKPRSEKDVLGIAMQKMTLSLRTVTGENERQNWVKTGQTELNEKMRGDLEINTLAKNIIAYLPKYLGAQIGSLYIADEKGKELKLYGSYAFTKRKSLNDTIKVGEGLVGEAAFEKEMISVTNIPENYIRISSSLGDEIPRNVVVTPFLHEEKLIGVIELGSFKEFSDTELDFLKTVMENIAIAVNSAFSRYKMQELLEKTQRQSEELQSQQEELKSANEELQSQQEELRTSNEELQSQQEELKAANEELEEKSESLEQQKAETQQKNIDLERARRAVEEKAEEVSIASKYKSEFLANMSHELRTPLNSILLLSRILSDNKDSNLSANQVESAGIIYNSGNDLLSLINEILDLSKIEAGKMDIEIDGVLISDLTESVKSNFQHVMDDKGIELAINVDENAPSPIFTDRKRLEQIIRNLMSNAIKFTEKGSVTVDFKRLSRGSAALHKSGLDPEKAIAIVITDTGMGISPEKQKVIFEAFQQAEGGTARKFGGTGLGLSISREIAKLLGGEIQLQSELGKGSTFTLYIPVKAETKQAIQTKTPAPQPATFSSKIIKSSSERPRIKAIPDDRDNLKKGDKTILVIEDDQNFAKILLNQCHDKGFKCLVSPDGEGGLRMAEKYMPEAIILDIKLPGIDGWTVLDVLKDNPKTRHIPVHMMSVEEETIDAFKKGAIGYLTKPVKKERLDEAFSKLEEVIGKEFKELLVVEDDENLRKSIVTLIGNGDVKISEAATGKEAINKLTSRKYDCVVLDLGLPDMTGFELLKKLEQKKDFVIPPIIVFTGKELKREEELELRKYSESIIIKGVKSEERLLDESALFLHRVVGNMPKKKQKMIINLHDKDIMLKDKKILLVDDDMRNVFAISAILQERGMNVIKAENGKKALEMLENETNVDLVLMDIMMPVMDGYETTKKIRQIGKFWKLPIIALTAKAMKEDREKCIAAGANDYLAKPVDVDRLLSMMRVWLYQ